LQEISRLRRREILQQHGRSFRCAAMVVEHPARCCNEPFAFDWITQKPGERNLQSSLVR
jgi:hypothetical protein